MMFTSTVSASFLCLLAAYMYKYAASQQFADNHCGYIKVKNPVVAFFGRNVTITFKPHQTRINTTAKLIDRNNTFEYEPQHHDHETNTFTFMLLHNRNDRPYRSFIARYYRCYSEWISYELKEPPTPTLGPRKNVDDCHNCLISSIGENIDDNKNGEPVISCSIANDIGWNVTILINKTTLKAHQYSQGKYRATYTVREGDHMANVVCNTTYDDITLVDTARLYVMGRPTTPLQSPKLVVTSDFSVPTSTIHVPITTKSRQTLSTQRITAGMDKTTILSNQSRQTRVETPYTKTHQPSTSQGKETVSEEVHKKNTDKTVMKTSAKNDGLQIIIIATVCGVSVLIVAIAVAFAVLCVRRKRRPAENVMVQNKTGEGQVAQEEGYASIGGAECEYAVVNKPKKRLTPQSKQAPIIESKSIELQSQLNIKPGAGVLLYADLDQEALSAKPTKQRVSDTLARPSTPTEYVGIDFVKSVAAEKDSVVENK